MESERLQIEWVTLNAIREMLIIAHKGANVTYSKTLEEAPLIVPSLYNQDSLFIQKEIENYLVRQYRQHAKAKSIATRKDVSPLELVQERIKELKDLVKIKNPSLETDALKSEIRRLKRIIPRVTPKEYYEDYLLHYDLKIDRPIFQPLPVDNIKHQDYKVSDEIALRIRLIHNEKPEKSLGADLIYEQHDEVRKLIRFAHLQYKIWDGKCLWFSRNDNLGKQLNKLRKALCDDDFCSSGQLFEDEYRLPFCSAFLRPTDKLQSLDNQLASSGLHLPICKIDRLADQTSRGNKKLEKGKICSASISYSIFEELFNNNMMGSRWITYKEAEKLYRKHKLLEPNENIVIHVQELGI